MSNQEIPVVDLNVEKQLSQSEDNSVRVVNEVNLKANTNQLADSIENQSEIQRDVLELEPSLRKVKPIRSSDKRKKKKKKITSRRNSIKLTTHGKYMPQKSNRSWPRSCHHHKKRKSRKSPT